MLSYSAASTPSRARSPVLHLRSASSPCALTIQRAAVARCTLYKRADGVDGEPLDEGVAEEVAVARD